MKFTLNQGGITTDSLTGISHGEAGNFDIEVTQNGKSRETSKTPKKSDIQYRAGVAQPCGRM